MPECGDSGAPSGPTSPKAFLDGAQRLLFAAPSRSVVRLGNGDVNVAQDGDLEMVRTPAAIGTVRSPRSQRFED